MNIPHATPEFAQAFAIAKALAFPGMHLKEDGLPEPYPRNLLDLRLAELAMNILQWSPDMIQKKLDHAKAEFIAERTSEIKLIREGLEIRRVQAAAPKVDPELLAKVSISL